MPGGTSSTALVVIVGPPSLDGTRTDGTNYGRAASCRPTESSQLIHADDGTHLWSERYDRDMTDVFAIQDEIGQAISEGLKLRLAPRAKTVNIEAYQNYLKGQYHFLRFTPESAAKAREFFEQALAIDPNY